MAERARAGDRTAFGELYARFRPAVEGLVRYLAGREGADDLVHDAFLLALRHLHTLHDGERFGPWLMQIARNRCRKWLADRATGPESVTEVEELH